MGESLRETSGGPTTVLSADLVAAAVIAAARAYGGDPLRVLLETGNQARRSVNAAVDGLSAATGITLSRAARLLGKRDSSNIATARRNGGAAFALASAAAARAASQVAPVSLVGEAVTLSQLSASPPTPRPGGSTPRTVTAAAVRREVCGVLHLEPCTAPDLAEILGLAEAAVRLALRELAEAGEARADPLTAEGWRVQYWRWSGT